MLSSSASLSSLSAADLSGMVGWVSIYVWVCVYSPQLHENYVLKSGEGLSITFIIIWLAGDALNMIGALREGLLPTMIILAGYYCLCDLALIWQYYYYRKHHDFYHPSEPSQPATESTPLIDPASSSISVKREHQPSLGQEVFRCAVGLALVSVAGVFTWYMTVHLGWAKHPTSRHFVDHPDHEPIEWKWDAQISGWASAFLYLSSRVPQILKNRQTKCEGLSLALFVFSVAGNLTYCASILIKDTSREYLIENMSWLVGSLGTVFLDFIVLGQFVHYRDERDRAERQQRDLEDAQNAGL